MPARTTAENYRLLDDLFWFIPEHFRDQFREQGLYRKIVTGEIPDAATFYEHVPVELLTFQDTDYRALAADLQPVLAPGAVLQIGCGLGDLLKHLAQPGAWPLYGIDACRGMIDIARERLRDYPQVQLFHGKAQSFSYERLAPLANVILNNFWGILPYDESARLLLTLKKRLAPGAKIIIGDLQPVAFPEAAIAAARIAAQEFHFVLHYPLFLEFFLLGFGTESVTAGGGEYSVLSVSG